MIDLAAAKELLAELERLEADWSADPAIGTDALRQAYYDDRGLLLAALRQAVEPWRPITDDDIGKTMLVTNNLHAKNARGEKSHRWITMIQKGAEDEGYVGFEQYTKLYGLTHCAPLPSAPPQEPSEP